MKPDYRRCLIHAVVLILLISTLTIPVLAASHDTPFTAEPWCYSVIFPEEDFVVPNTIIIYIPGAGHTGSGEKDLERFAYANHPLKYSREETLPIPDDCVIVCLQSFGESDFRKNPDKICEITQMLSQNFPDASIILAGHSNGALATYKVASLKDPSIDGYVFISGTKEANCEELSLIPNCLVVYGYESMLGCRKNFSNLFYNTDITDRKYHDEIAYVEEQTNNAYFVSKKWDHGSAPKIFQEDFFWEWINNITPLSNESN